ncbi:MAG: biopolymer transporter ExbD [Fibromonadaceae bacterium]|jgi:biopolymer transport protein ExbD|nr:biopolymer transporter ExbD [Fibromonadaceae bacterium]
MARQMKTANKYKEMDILPVMSLMTVLIPVLLSMSAFQKLAIVDINLPERSEISRDSEPPPPDDNALNLTVAISKDEHQGYIEIWARGGSLPKIFFREMWTFRCRSDNDTITHDPRTVNKENPPKCQDGRTLDPDRFQFSIETIHLWALHKESEEDPGRILMSVYSKNDSAYVDGNNDFVTSLEAIRPGSTVATLAANSARRLACGQSAPGVEDVCSGGQLAATLRPRSAYDELARLLMALHSRFIDSPDADNITIVADDDTAFDKLVGVMDRARDSGFYKIQLAKLAAGE